MYGLNTVRRRIFCRAMAQPSVRESLKTVLHDEGIEIVTDTENADVLLVDLRPDCHTQQTIGATIKTARQRAYGLSAIFLVDQSQYADPQIAALLSRDYTVPLTSSNAPLMTAIRRCVSAKATADELSIRTLAATDLGLPLPLTEITFRPTITLLQCTPSPLALEVLGELSVCMGMNASIRNGQSLNALESGRADALILLADKNRRQQASLVRMLRRHSDLSDIPIIVLETKPNERHLSYWSGNGADYIFSTHQTTAVMGAVEQLRNRRKARQNLLQQLRLASLNDKGAVSRLASSRFFEACVFERVRQHMPFSLGALRLHAEHRHADDKEALAEVAIYLSMAMPEVDLVSRIGTDAFLLSLAGCDHRSATKAMSKVAKMIGDLQFGPQDSAQTFVPRTNVACSSSHTSATDLLRTAIAGLKSETPELATTHNP